MEAPITVDTVTVKPRRLVRSAFTYSATNLIGQSAQLVSMFVIRRFIAPVVMGNWDMARVVRGYLQPIGAGAMQGAARELPILRGSGNLEAEYRCRSVATLYSTLEMLAISVGLVLYALVTRGSRGETATWALLAVACMMPLLRLEEIFIPFFQGANLYVPLSRVLIVSNVAYGAALAVGAMLGGLPGLLVGAVAGAAIRGSWIVISARRAGLTVGRYWNGGIWRELVSYGLVYKLTSYPNTFFLSLDLVWVTRFFARGELAFYALAKTFYTQASEITTRFATVFLTRTLTQYGATVERKSIASDMWRFAAFQMTVSVPLVTCGIASAVPLLIRHVIPAYATAIPLSMVLLISSFFTSQNNNLFSIWIAEKRLTPYGVSNVAGVVTVAGALATGWFVLGERSLEAVAWAAVIGFAAYFAFMCATAARELWGGARAALLFVIGVGAGVWTALALWLGPMREPATGSLVGDIAPAVRGAAIAIATALPLVVAGCWHTGVLAAGVRWLRARRVPRA